MSELNFRIPISVELHFEFLSVVVRAIDGRSPRKRKDAEGNTKFVELGRYFWEVPAYSAGNCKVDMFLARFESTAPESTGN